MRLIPWSAISVSGYPPCEQQTSSGRSIQVRKFMCQVHQWLNVELKHLGVSINGDTQKWIVYKGKSH